MIEFTSFTSNKSERNVTFDNIKLDKAWCVRHLGIERFILASVEITVQIRDMWSEWPSLRISGGVRDETGVPVLQGQVLGALMDSPLRYNRKFTGLAEIWLRYHMNDAPACSARQLDELYGLYLHGELTVGQMMSRESRQKFVTTDVTAEPTCGGPDEYIPIPKETLDFLQHKIFTKGRLD